MTKPRKIWRTPELSQVSMRDVFGPGPGPVPCDLSPLTIRVGDAQDFGPQPPSPSPTFDGPQPTGTLDLDGPQPFDLDFAGPLPGGAPAFGATVPGPATFAFSLGPFVPLGIQFGPIVHEEVRASGPQPQPSDVRLKQDIAQVGVTAHGLPLYIFRYRGQQGLYEGVMAQDVLKVRPDAVVVGADGFYLVDYAKLGIEFRRIN